MKIGIVEDELLVADMMSDALVELGYEVSRPAISYTRAIKMVEEFQPDLLLLDIQLSGSKDGIDLAQLLRERELALPIIFLTANSDRATIERAKFVRPEAYLVKPFNRRDLFAAIEIAFSNYSMKSMNASPFARSLFLKEGQSFDKVQVTDILFMEADHVYVTYHIQDGRSIKVRSQLKDAFAQLNPHLFFQCHRAFVVNLSLIDRVADNLAYIGTFVIPVSRSNRDSLLAALSALR